MGFLTHFHFKSVLSSNTHRWLGNIYYSKGVAEVPPVISLSFLFNSSQLFFLLHDKHFETNEKNSNRIDESITIHRLVWWVGWNHFLFSSLHSLCKKLHLIALRFVHCSMIKLRYFWWNYFYNNFSFAHWFVETSFFVDGRSVGTHSYFIIRSSTSRM